MDLVTTLKLSIRPWQQTNKTLSQGIVKYRTFRWQGTSLCRTETRRRAVQVVDDVVCTSCLPRARRPCGLVVAELLWISRRTLGQSMSPHIASPRQTFLCTIQSSQPSVLGIIGLHFKSTGWAKKSDHLQKSLTPNFWYPKCFLLYQK